MTKLRPPLFLERASYRRRRIMDAARLLPVAGFLLILLPVLWARSGGDGIAGEAIYLFLLWGALVLAAAALAGPLRRALSLDDTASDERALPLETDRQPPARTTPASPPPSPASPPHSGGSG